MSLPTQKLAAKTVSLLIFELAARNYVADDLEIGRDGGVILTLIFFCLGVYIHLLLQCYQPLSTPSPTNHILMPPNQCVIYKFNDY
jgi:hypothetical protein